MEPSLTDQLRYLEQRVAADPDNVSLRQELLRCQSRALRWDPGVALARSLNVEVLYALSPRDPEVMAVLAALVDPGFEPPQPGDREAGAALGTADLALAEDRLEDAGEELRGALMAAPSSPLVHLRLAELANLERRWETALEHARFALDRAPDSARVWAACAGALRGLQRWAEAFDHDVEALVQNPLCAAAEAGLVAAGPRLGYRWRRVPIAAQVWPLIRADGSASLMARRYVPPAPRRAWIAWARAVVAGCRAIPPERAPLAGLPRDLTLLRDSHQALLRTWRRWRWWGRRRPVRAGRDLRWLTAVQADGLLDAYLLFAYLHPDLADAWRESRERRPGDTERLIRGHLARPVEGA